MSVNRPFAALQLVLAAVVLAVPLQAVRADTGPKPGMTFYFVYETSPAPAIVSGIMDECSQEDCADAEPLRQMGPQHFSCDSSGCTSLAYSYSSYHRLSIDFSDGRTRQSNVFGKRYFYAVYQVTVRDGDLLVQEQRGGGQPFPYSLLSYGLLGCILIPTLLLPAVLLIMVAIRVSMLKKAWGLYVAAWLVSLFPFALTLLVPSMLGGLLVTLAVEMALAVGYGLWRKRPMVLLLTVVWIMNLITRPLFSFVFGESFSLAGGSLVGTLVAELVIWLLEAGILALALRKQAKWWEAFALSAVLNLASFGIGLLLPF